MSEVALKILPPWSIDIKMFQALFGGDPEITCTPDYNSADPSIVLACNNGDKVAALLQILPEEIEFGNVALEVVVDGTPSNRAFKTKKELFEVAFDGNPAFAYAVTAGEENWWMCTTYVVFKNCVVQFFADNLNDCHGIVSLLYQYIAEDILTGPATDGVFFNTDVEVGNLGIPLGEWP